MQEHCRASWGERVLLLPRFQAAYACPCGRPSQANTKGCTAGALKATVQVQVMPLLGSDCAAGATCACRQGHPTGSHGWITSTFCICLPDHRIAGMAWQPVSTLGIYQNSAPSTTFVHAQHPSWAMLQQQQQQQLGAPTAPSPLQGMVFQQVLPDEQMHLDRHHIYIKDAAQIPDASEAEMAQQAEMHTASGLAGSDMPAAKLLAADALYKLEPTLCDKMNAHLKGSGFGPFEHVGSAVFRLLQLRESGKAAKAEKLEERLTSFADAHHGSMECFMQWPDLLRIKKQRDAFAHPLDIPKLQSMIVTTTQT